MQLQTFMIVACLFLCMRVTVCQRMSEVGCSIPEQLAHLALITSMGSEDLRNSIVWWLTLLASSCHSVFLCRNLLILLFQVFLPDVYLSSTLVVQHCNPFPCLFQNQSSSWMSSAPPEACALSTTIELWDSPLQGQTYLPSYIVLTSTSWPSPICYLPVSCWTLLKPPINRSFCFQMPLPTESVRECLQSHIQLIVHIVNQGSPSLVLKIYCPIGFRSNSAPKHLNQMKGSYDAFAKLDGMSKR